MTIFVAHVLRMSWIVGPSFSGPSPIRMRWRSKLVPNPSAVHGLPLVEKRIVWGAVASLARALSISSSSTRSEGVMGIRAVLRPRLCL